MSFSLGLIMEIVLKINVKRKTKQRPARQVCLLQVVLVNIIIRLAVLSELHFRLFKELLCIKGQQFHA